MNYVILSPRPTSGGALVLHVLCKELLKKGHNAKILYIGDCLDKEQTKFYIWKKWLDFTIKDFVKRVIHIFSKYVSKNILYEDYFYNSGLRCKRKFFPLVDQDTIVVYPDVIYGNILNAKKVVRWFLYFNRFKGDTRAYGTNDLFFCYRPIFNDAMLNPDCNTMYLQNFDFNLYKQVNFGERQGGCYVVRKGSARNDLPEQFDGPIIDDWSEKNKVKALNKYKYCYFYDSQTFYTVIAAVCGCIPIVVMEPGKSKSDYLSKGEHPVGVAYGDSEEEMAYAVSTRQNCIEYLKHFDIDNGVAVERFINTCNDYFK